MLAAKTFLPVQNARAPVPSARPHVPASRPSTLCRMKKDVHPEYFEEAPVVCNGVEVMRLSGTKPQYNVDIYSGNHPFYLGNRATMIVDEGQLNRFKKRFADMGELSEVGAAASIAGKAEDPTAKPKAKQSAPQKGGKKK